MKNLINILRTNGTGLFSGHCRIKSTKNYGNFEEWLKYYVDKIQDKPAGSNHDYFEIIFSLNEKNLGTFKCVCESSYKRRDGEVHLVHWLRLAQQEYIYFLIDFSQDPDFAEFKAILFPSHRLMKKKVKK